MNLQPISTAEDQDKLCEMLSEAFHSELEGCRSWVVRTGLENFHGAYCRERLSGCLMTIPMAQWYLGRAVDMVGIAAVAVSPEARGRGVARAMMTQMLQDQREQGTALSVLYASTMPLYRRVGYQSAGCRCRYSVPLKSIAQRLPQGMKVEEVELEQEAELRDFQQATVRGHGALRRGPYVWERTRAPRGKQTKAFRFIHGGRLIGFCRYYQEQNSRGEWELQVTDLVASCSLGAAGALSFLGGHQSLCQNAVWYGGPGSPWLHHLSDRTYVVEITEEWMLRLVHLPQAFCQRGYPSGLRARLALRVHDPVLFENDASWLLEVEGGIGRLSRIENPQVPEIEVDVGLLASLYSGHLTVDQAVLTGGLSGLPEALSLASCVLAAPAPQLSDFF